MGLFCSVGNGNDLVGSPPYQRVASNPNGYCWSLVGQLKKAGNNASLKPEGPKWPQNIVSVLAPVGLKPQNDMFMGLRSCFVFVWRPR